MSARIESDRTAFRTSHIPCPQCPWKLENQGRRHPGGWYTKANLRRLWGGLRRGERMTCHPTDPDNAVECQCHTPPPPGTVTRECAGALIVIQREVQRVNDILVAGGSWADYRREHPRGLTKEGAACHVMASAFATNSLTGYEMGRPNLNDPTIGHADLVPWVPK